MLHSFRGILVLAAVAWLGGCSASSPLNKLGASIPGIGSCNADSEALKEVDWDKARIVTIDIRQGAFDPIVLRLRRDEPYLFHFNNRDNSSRTFRAPGFFGSIAIDRVSVGATDLTDHCMVGVSIPPKTPVEMRFVPLRDGRYEFEDTTFGVPLIFAGGANGVVYISVPRQPIESPTNFRVVEPPPVPLPSTTTAPVNRPAPAPGGFPIDPSLQSPPPVSSLPSDMPASLPGDAPVSLPGDAPVSLPGDAPISLPGDAPVSLPGDAPVRLPGDSSAAPAPAAAATPRPAAPQATAPQSHVTLPGDEPFNVPANAPIRLPGDPPLGTVGESLAQ